MRRIVWIGAALLIMVGIFGYAMFTMRGIEQVNQERREKNAGQEIVNDMIAATTATTSVWDRLRTTETTVVTGETEAEPVETDDPNGMQEAQILNPTEEQDPGIPVEENVFSEAVIPTEEPTVMTIIIND